MRKIAAAQEMILTNGTKKERKTAIEFLNFSVLSALIFTFYQV
jgi:hypothetical protein